MSTKSRPHGQRRAGERSRLGVLARVLAATLGAYGLAVLTSLALALASRTSREEAVVSANMVALLVFVGVVLWAFAARTAARAWLGLAVPALALGAMVWWLRSTGMTS